MQGDPLMDAVVEWMTTEGIGRTKPLFDRALERGIGEVPDAPQPLVDLFAVVDKRPSWVDPKRLLDGARFCGIAGRTGLDALRDFALVAGYQASAVNRTLLLTGALEKGQQRRIAETTKWWVDCTRPGGMERFADGFKSTLKVRLIHALVRRHLRGLPEWDEATWGLPINQGDLQATNLAFSVVYLLSQRMLGVIVTRAEARSVMHLWRYVGWLIGVDPAWACDTEEQGRIALYQNALSQAPADETSKVLGAALVDEPLLHHYQNFPWLRGHWNRAKHLSIARAYLGAQIMETLGLPRGILPWYPLLTVGPRLLWHGLHRLVPGGRERLIERGLVAQAAMIDVLFGRGEEARVEASHVMRAHAQA
jgi:hypothetical protein